MWFLAEGARPGVYVEASSWSALQGWEQYRVRVHAFAAANPAAVLCLESAAVLLGLPVFGNTRDIHIYDAQRAASRRYGDVCVHTSETPREVVSVAGIAVTSLLDTAVDLARVVPPAQGLAIVDSAISPHQGGLCSLDELRTRSNERATSRGAAVLREVWPLADARIESPYESVSHAAAVWSGFERPDLQVSLGYDGFHDRVDFYFPTRRAIGEADGWAKYALMEPQIAVERIKAEKRREDRLRRRHPFGRWEPADAHRVDPVCRVLRELGVPLVRKPDRFLLATFRHTPRSFRGGESAPWAIPPARNHFGSETSV